MKKGAWLDRLRYVFDSTLSRGPIALVGWLGFASATLIILATLIVWGIAGSEQLSLPVIFWDILFQSLTPNPVDPGAGPWVFLLAMLIVTLGSLFMVSILVGVLTTGIEDRLRSLRKGRSRVLESDHTIILGWDEHIFTVITELVIANENQRRSCIVILGDKDKVEMEDEIREKVHHPGRTRIVCRSGNPIDQTDLEIVNLNAARSIIILASGDDDPDAHVIKVLLAIVNNPHRRPEPYHIVAEVHDPANLEAAQLVGGEEAKIVLIGHLTSHIIAQTCRRSGLPMVYTELLNFEGDEIYFQDEPALTGKTFGESLFAYEDSSVIGIRFQGGGTKLNPPMDTRLREGDRIIAISEDDDTARLSGLEHPEIQWDAICLGPSAPAEAERMLILGWNWRAPAVICELEHYVAPGSLITVVAEDPTIEAQITLLRDKLENQAIGFKAGNTTSRNTLAQLGIETYHHVVVLAYSDTLPVQKADARTLVTLLHLRDIARRTGQTFSIVSEMLDERNRDLAEITQANDFIVSGKLASLLLAQISENQELLDVFEDLFSAEGAEIYLKPVSRYVKLDEPITFYTVVEAARQRDEIAFGYRLRAYAGDAEQGYGVVVNPDKSRLVTFAEQDQIIVLAEEE